MRHNRLIRTLFVAFLAVSLSTSSALGQAGGNYTLDPESELWIEGTSTRSDWTVYASDVSGTFTLDPSANPLKIQAAHITVRASEVESRRSTIMDRLIDDALKVDEHPEIRYQLTSATDGGEATSFNTEGQLTLAGETRKISMTVRSEPLSDGRYRFSGSHALKMSDYGMEAPTAMFGALRTGDNVTVHFNVVAKPN